MVLSVPAWFSLCALDVFGMRFAAASYVPVDPFVPNLPSLIGDLELGQLPPSSIRELVGDHRRIVVYASCPSCSLPESERTDRLARNPKVLIIDATGDNYYFTKLAEATRSKNIRFADTSVVRDLNVAFSPRYYELGADGRITYIQHNPDEDFELRAGK